MSSESSQTLLKEERAQTVRELKSKANELKLQGDNDLNNNEFDKAIQAYAEAVITIKKLRNLNILSKPELESWINEIVVPSNLNISFVNVKQQNWSDAINHASKVLYVEPNNTKALYRRCWAYINKGDWDKGEVDLNSWRGKLSQSKELKILEQAFTEKIKQLETQEGKQYKSMFKNYQHEHDSNYRNGTWKCRSTLEQWRYYVKESFIIVKNMLCCKRKCQLDKAKKI